MHIRQKLKNTSTIILIGLGVAGILSGCSGPKKIGENTYKFKDTELRLNARAELRDQDSIILLYVTDEESFPIKVACDEEIKWMDKIQQNNTYSFKAKKISDKKSGGKTRYKIQKESIKKAE